jgi:hypothetical protein
MEQHLSNSSMKITYPRENRRVRGNGEDVLYVIVCRFNDGLWSFADFWGEKKPMKYTAKSYREALILKKKIEARARLYHWEPHSVAIAKIAL